MKVVNLDDCIEWDGFIRPASRGKDIFEGICYDPELRRNNYVHLVVYKEVYGPIPEGHQVDHLCGNHLCIMSDHLEAVLPKINVRRSSVTKLTEEQVREIQTRRGQGEKLADLAREFNITPQYVSQLSYEKNWR